MSKEKQKFAFWLLSYKERWFLPKLHNFVNFEEFRRNIFKVILVNWQIIKKECYDIKPSTAYFDVLDSMTRQFARFLCHSIYMFEKMLQLSSFVLQSSRKKKFNFLHFVPTLYIPSFVAHLFLSLVKYR